MDPPFNVTVANVVAVPKRIVPSSAAYKTVPPVPTLNSCTAVAIPVMLRFLPDTSSYVISPVASRLPPTVIAPDTFTSVALKSTIVPIPEM